MGEKIIKQGGRRGKLEKVKIVMIDDGIDFTDFNKERIIKSYKVIDNKVVYINDNKSANYMNGENFKHGTICEYVLSNFTDNYELYSIDIFSGISSEGWVNNLLIALEWAVENTMDIVHMSLGTTNFKYFKIIEEKIKYVRNNNIIMIAASSNDDILTYPACLPEVIGVKDSKGYKTDLKKGQYIYNYICDDGIEIAALSPANQKELNHKLDEKNVLSLMIEKCNSFTAPYITAKVVEFMKLNIRSYYSIIEELKRKADYIYGLSCNNKIIAELNNSNIKSIDIDCPNIVVCCENKFYSKVITEYLNLLFRSNGYNSAAIGKNLYLQPWRGTFTVRI